LPGTGLARVNENFMKKDEINCWSLSNPEKTNKEE
jgi:hypothetical protein